MGALLRAAGTALVVLLAVSLPMAAVAGKGWSTGRATYYGNEPWAWSIHYGSCGFYYIWPDQSTGWDVAALSDHHPDFRGSCGVCYEVRCKGNSSFADGYGQWLDRKSSCKDSSASVVLKITDTCPCSYPGNYYSNKRWCCGDMNHFDISVFAFEKLAELKWGVIPIEYRRVACDAKPEKKAGWTSTPLPGEFPPLWAFDWRPTDFYFKYFPRGGYLNSKAGDGSGWVTVDEWIKRAKLKKAGKPYSKSSMTGSSSSSNGGGSGSSSSGGSNSGKTTQESNKQKQQQQQPKPQPKPAPVQAAPAPAPIQQPVQQVQQAPPPTTSPLGLFNLFGLFGRR